MDLSKRFRKTALKTTVISCLTVALLLQTVAQATVKSSIEHLAFSKDSQQILFISNRDFRQSTRSATPLIQFINVQNGQSVNTTELSINPQQQMVMGFTPDGFKLAVLEAKGLSIVHNKTGQTLRTLPVPALPRPVVRYRPNLAITNASGTQQLFHAASQNKLNVIHTGNGKNLASIQLPKQRLLSMGMSENGRIVAFLTVASGAQHTLHLFDIYSKKVVDTLDLPAQKIAPFAKAIVFSADGKQVFVGSLLVNLGDKKVTPFPASTRATPAIFTPNKRYLLLPHGTNQMLRYDLIKQQKQVINLKLPSNCTTNESYDISPNKALLAIGSVCVNGQMITVLNAHTGELIRNLQPKAAVVQ